MPDTTHERWRHGLESERVFWENWLVTKGAAWPEDFAMRIDPETELQPHVARHLIEPLSNPVRILDVGAGPMTVLGKRLANHELRITALDPLATFFDELIAEHGLTPPVSTRPGDGETLLDVVAPGAFDLAYARNSVDHSYEPVDVIRQMLGVVKPGCRIVLEHRIDEAEHERYEGLHQWNFRADNNRLILWRPGTTIDVEERLADTAHLIEVTEAGEWLIAALERRSPPKRARWRLRRRG